MCILFFALEQHPKYPVIICANRDEFHQRPTQAMHWWENKDVLAGKDLQAGGTWLGLNNHARFSALTNFRQPQLFDKNKQSRGELVLQALVQSSNDMQKHLEQSTQTYNGYNLVYGDLDNLFCFDSVKQKVQHLGKGFHSLCNGALDDIWPKMALGQSALSDCISKNKALDINNLLALMQNNQQAETQYLPKTGIPLDWEQLLSSIFIVSPDYGTRTTTIITQDNNGKVEIFDRSYNALGACFAEQSFEFIPMTSTFS